MTPATGRRIAALSPDRLAALARRRGSAPLPPATPRADGSYPPSPAQRRMWFLHEQHGGASTLFPTAFRIRGALDVPRLEAALHRLVERHQALSTCFVEGDGDIGLVPRSGLAPDVGVVDLRGVGEDLAATQLEQVVAARTSPIDLRAGPLVRATIVRLSDDDHLLHLVVDHSTVDGRSLALLTSELSELYSDPADGAAPAGQGSAYLDACAWAAERAATADVPDAAPADVARATAPPTDVLPGGPARTATLSRRVPEACAERMAEVCRTEGTSRFSFVLAGAATVLGLVQGDRDVAVATVASGRTHPATADLVGCFVSTLPIALHVDRSTTFRQLLGAAHRTSSEAIGRQEVPYEHQVAHGRAVEVLVQLQPPYQELRMGDLTVIPVELQPPAPHFPLAFEVRPGTDGVVASVQVDASRYLEATAQVLLDTWVDLLVAASHEPDRPVGELLEGDPGDPAEGPPAATDDLVHRLVARAAHRHPDRVAFVEGDRTTTAGTLQRLVGAAAAELAGRGVGPGDVVGVHAGRGLTLAVAALATLRRGAAFLLLDTSLPPALVVDLVAYAGARVVVAPPEGSPRVDLGVPVVRLDVARLGRAVGREVPTPSHAAAYLIPTSGSSGPPKLVVNTHGGVVNRIRWFEDRHGWSEGARPCVQTPVAFADVVWQTFGPLAAGQPVTVVPDGVEREPDALLDLLEDEQVTHLVAVPSLYRALARTAEDRGKAPPLEMCMASGEPVDGHLLGQVRRALGAPTFVNVYGMTEIAADAAWRPAMLEDEAMANLGAGHPLPGMRMTILDPDGRPVPRGAVGELHVEAEVLAHGYAGDPALTADRFRPARTGPPGSRALRTGDRARRRPTGELEILGRIDQQVKIRGQRVDLAAVEAALVSVPGVRRAAAVVHEDGGPPALAAFVEGRELEPGRIRAQLAERVPAAWVPSTVTVVDRLPSTRTGKVDRRALPAPRVDSVGGRPPETDHERAVAAAFVEVLGCREVAAADDFFAVGGDSLAATQLVAALRTGAGVDLRMTDLLAAPTVAGLAAALAGSRPAEGTPVQVVPDPAGGFEPFPMTPVQEAYWLGRDADLELGGVATHSYLEVEVRDLRHADLREALHRAIDRHPMLRAVMRPDGTQVVLETVPLYPMAVTDLRDADGDVAQAHLAAVRAEMSHQVLPSDRWPLFDIRVTDLPGGRSRLHVSMDALICDMRSWRTLVQEIAAVYADPQARIPPPSATFRDWVLATRRSRAGREESERWWRQQVETMPPGPALPVERALADIERPRFVRRAATLGPRAWRALRELAASRRVTPSALLLTAFTDVLRRWSGTDDFTTVLTLFNRPSSPPDLARVVGDFTSLLPVRTGAEPAASFEDRARTAQACIWAAMDHAAVDGVTVLREWARAHGRDGVAAMNVVFTSAVDDDDGDDDASLGDQVYAVSQTPQVLVDHQAGVAGGALHLTWDTVDDAFPLGLVDDMFTAYTALVEHLARVGPADLPDPLPAEQRRTRRRTNATRGPEPTARLEDLVLARAAEHPDRPAVIAPERTLTFGELVASAGAVATRLRARGVAIGDRVAVSMPKGPEQVVAVLACAVAGAVYVPVDPGLPPLRAAHIHRSCGTRAWLVRAADDPSWLPDDVEAVAVAPSAARGATTIPGDRGGLDALAYVIHTSGSTGVPKGVAVTHRSAANTIIDLNDRFAVGPDDRVLGLSSLSFDLSVYDVFGVLGAGGALVLPDPGRLRDPAHWLDVVARHRVSIWNSVPALMQLAVEVAERRRRDLPDLRLVMLSGDWVPITLPARVRERAPGADVISLGGATEAAIWSIAHRVEGIPPGWTSVPYGRPLRNQTFHVLDARMQPRPDWVPGELFIGGIGLAQGYWGDPDQTAARFVVHPTTGERLYRTGDLGRYHPEGDIEFLGRDDGQVKVGGYRIELGEVEHALLEVDGVSAAVVAVVGQPRGDRRLVAHYVATDERLDPATVRAVLGQRLPSHAIPAHLVALDELPLTENGKVDRRALPPVATRPPEAPAGPASELEQRLAALWERLLSVPRVGLDDSFFELGGTSMMGIRLIAALEERFGVELRLGLLYRAPTVRELAALVVDARGGSRGTGPPALRPDPEARFQPFPLTDVQVAYWLGRRAGQALGGVATHGYTEIDVRDLDVAALEAALRHLVDRHDMLRTVVRRRGDQVVLADVPRYELRRLDLSQEPAVERDRRLAELRDHLSHRVADPSQWPLFDIRATRIDERTTRLHVSVDLMLGDARSTRLLHEELAALYAGRAVEELPAIGCTFRDYVLAAAALRTSEAWAVADRYWDEKIPTLAPPPALPYELGASTLVAPRFERRAAVLPAARWRALRDRAARASVTASGVLCAAYAEVLARYSASPRFTLNLTTLDRHPLHPDVDRLVGDFTSTALVVVDGGGPSFGERARAVQAELWDVLDHRLVSGIEVLSRLRRTPERRALASMPVVFTSALADGGEPAGPAAPAWEGTTVFSVSQTPQVLLDHQAFEVDSALSYSWDHVPAAFPPGVIDAMFRDYGALLARLVDDDGAWDR